MTATEQWQRGLAIAATCGSGLAGGVFLAYSTFTMRALRHLPPVQGLQAMQQVNRFAERSAGLMATLFGTAAACVAVAVLALRDRSGPWVVQVAGATVFLVAVVGMTVAFHVPRNDAVARVDPASPGAASAWLDYARAWTAGNHVRTLGGLAAAAMFAWSLRTGDRPPTAR